MSQITGTYSFFYNVERFYSKFFTLFADGSLEGRAVILPTTQMNMFYAEKVKIFQPIKTFNTDCPIFAKQETVKLRGGFDQMPTCIMSNQNLGRIL
jgi:hypothetical protein